MVTRADEAGRGKAALLRAIAIDDALPEVHVALANERTWQDWDWPAAEQSFRRALDLNPSFAEAHSFYAHYLYITGRPREGAAAMQRALELDPLNDLIQQFYGMTLRWDGRYEEGIAHAQRVLQTSPNSPSAWGALVDNLYALGRHEDSLAAQRKALGVREAPAIAEALTRGYAAGGYRGAMQAAADARAARGQSWPAAQLYTRAGLPGQALDWLERGLADKNPNMPYVGLFPVFQPLRSDARFQAILQQMNLPR
jgi:tetratricopeptide (TPR) repeat protein